MLIIIIDTVSTVSSPITCRWTGRAGCPVASCAHKDDLAVSIIVSAIVKEVDDAVV